MATHFASASSRKQRSNPDIEHRGQSGGYVLRIGKANAVPNLYRNQGYMTVQDHNKTLTILFGGLGAFFTRGLVASPWIIAQNFARADLVVRAVLIFGVIFTNLDKKGGTLFTSQREGRNQRWLISTPRHCRRRGRNLRFRLTADMIEKGCSRA
ncbi:MAG: hypothetical protein ACRD9S_03700 [Pyrinomonadaceae bacterium]